MATTAVSTAGLSYQELISGSASSRPLFNAPVQVVYDAIVGNMAALDNFFNAEVYAAENNLPEGERVEVTITGWNVPFIGNVGQTVANDVNAQWRAGKIRDPYHITEALLAWPEFPTAIASYDASTDELVLRYLKGQPWFIWIFGIILGILGINSLLRLVGINLGQYAYSLFGVTPKSNTSPSPSTSTGMPLWEKLAIGGVATLFIGGGILFAAEIKLREAGASKSSQEIIVER